MNPSKIEKMDEEVQKWSKKDPMAILKAMIYPGIDYMKSVTIFLVCIFNKNFNIFFRIL